MRNLLIVFNVLILTCGTSSAQLKLDTLITGIIKIDNKFYPYYTDDSNTVFILYERMPAPRKFKSIQLLSDYELPRDPMALRGYMIFLGDNTPMSDFFLANDDGDPFIQRTLIRGVILGYASIYGSLDGGEAGFYEQHLEGRFTLEAFERYIRRLNSLKLVKASKTKTQRAYEIYEAEVDSTARE